jgi:hypothetical protein
VVVLGGTGTAFACDGGGDAPAPAATDASLMLRSTSARSVQRTTLLRAITSYLGITRADLTVQLGAGKTLAQVADGTRGKSAAGLVASLVKNAQTKAQLGAAKGKLTRLEQQRVLGLLATKLGFLVEGRPHVPPSPR